MVLHHKVRDKVTWSGDSALRVSKVVVRVLRVAFLHRTNIEHRYLGRCRAKYREIVSKNTDQLIRSHAKMSTMSWMDRRYRENISCRSQQNEVHCSMLSYMLLSQSFLILVRIWKWLQL